MKLVEVREKYIAFFTSAPRNHKEISPAPLVLENDPTTLFTSSGMQPLVPYLMGEPHPEGKRLVDSQPSIRIEDIEEVGDNRHTTFFEMLGNWSLGEYFKEKQLAWFWEFLTSDQWLDLPKEKLWVSVFEGSDAVPRDEESARIWKSLGVPEERIFYYSAKKNWWSRAGTPDQMPEGEIGGPDSEVFFEFDSVQHDPKFGENCHPNCDCGRFLEIGNSVFMQYKKTKDGLEELPNKNVDFGGGLERLTAATLNNPDVFKIDVFEDLINRIQETSGKEYNGNEENMRLIADHIRASVFLIHNGVHPSNKEHGYIARRLIRRAFMYMRYLDNSANSESLWGMSKILYEKYRYGYLESLDVEITEKVISEEIVKFQKVLSEGMGHVINETNKYKLNVEDGAYHAINSNVSQYGYSADQFVNELPHAPSSLASVAAGTVAFNSLATYGFPAEDTIPYFEKVVQPLIKTDFLNSIELDRTLHKNFSRTQSAGMFKGGLADHSEETTQLHTATHLLHAALRKVLGDHVGQKGSNITAERLRFDFTHPDKLTDVQIKQIEDLVNEQIDKNLSVTMQTMSLEEARKSGALAFFGDKYDEKVNVYTIGDPRGEWFSKEVCGGPHVKKLSELSGHVRITKEQSSAQNVRRLYAVIEK